MIHALLKKICILLLLNKVIYIYNFIWSNMSFKLDVSLLIFYVNNVSSKIIDILLYCLLLISLFRSINICFAYLGVLRCIYNYKCYIFMSDRYLYNNVIFIFVFYYSLYFILKSISSNVSITTSSFFWFSFA